jgi:guanine nucleotide-binding protein subunit beta
MPPKDDPEYISLKKEIEALTEQLKTTNDGNKDKTLEELTSELGDATRIKLSTKRQLKGHIHKVNAVDFAGDSRY